MSRQVCGNCLCPYGDDGKCACVEDQETSTAAERMAGYLENDGNDCKCAAYGACECACGANWAEYHVKDAAKLLRSQAAEIERLKAELGDLPEAQAMLMSDCKVKGALLRQALEALAKYTTPGVLGGRVPIDAELVAAIKQHLGEV